MPQSKVTKVTTGVTRAAGLRRVFPPPGEGSATFVLVEDDGLSLDHARGGRTRLTFDLAATPAALTLTLRCEGSYRLPYTRIKVCKPAAETRPLALEVAPWAGGTAPVLYEGPFRMHGL